ncbi:hypothetical protein BCO37747_04467 [Burkholderia contaminans]|jgi:hypothetical protein|nr:hypothetical protein SK875_A02754 [Burkholderia contaminans]VWC44111.1 hypothetical protein BCO23253_07349 [Burkholderia contaminans]VWD28322.1 hypothetical protein BCO37747_04467 [Burkholderia contaminans]
MAVVVLDLSPVVGSAASIPILGESASPIDFIGAEITIGAARHTHPSNCANAAANPGRLARDQPAPAYSVESVNPSASSTRPTRISAVRSICVPCTLSTMSASVPVTRASSGQLAR